MKVQESTGREGWILDEDRALRDLLDDVHVSDNAKPDRKVGVWFGHPDQELRAQNYPYITLDLVDISEELDRAERGFYFWQGDNLSAALSDNPPQEGDVFSLDVPIPIRLTYQITTFARNPRHDRQMLNQIIRNGIIPMQGGVLFTSDGTNRRLDVLDFAKRDSVETNKRLLSNVLIVAVSSEVPWNNIVELSRVSSIWMGLRMILNQGDESIVFDEEHIYEKTELR